MTPWRGYYNENMMDISLIRKDDFSGLLFPTFIGCKLLQLLED